MKIETREILIQGQWILQDGKMIEDYECKRINWLKNEYLYKIATDDTGWISLYQDPNDKRYWELYFPFGEMQGGGPPSLRNISFQEAIKRYNIKS